VPIVVNNVTYFAFGIFHGGGFAIWAAGEAGWHNVQPSKAYQSRYEHMTEGLSLLYYLVEVYDGGKKMPVDVLWKEYAKTKKITPTLAAERFYAHAPFLASRMVKREEGIMWGHTSFYQHLRKAHPEAFLPRSQRNNSPPAAKTSVPRSSSAASKPTAATPKFLTEPARRTTTRTQTKEASSRAESVDTMPKKATRSTEPPQAPPAAPAQTAAKKISRPRKASQQREASQAPLLSEMDKTRARDVWKFMQRKTNDTLPEIAEMTIETFARFLFQEYQFQDEKEAQYFLKHLAPDLVGMMSIRRNRSYDPWTELPVYDELMEAKVPPRVKAQIAAIKLQKREIPLPGADDDESEASDEDSSEESVMDKEEATNRKREASRRRISALRPKSGSKYSGKATKRKGKERAVTPEEDEEMMDADGNVYDATEEDAMSVDTPTKRKSMPDDDDEDDEEEEEEEEVPEYPNKRFTRSRGDVDPELRDLEFEVQQAKSTNLPVRRKLSIPTTNGHASSESQSRMALVSEPAPFTDANAPGDMWNCPNAGCVHKVYGASEFASKELIREHLLDHKEKDRVDLIKDEENMTHLPVSHLLKRIRDMAERAGGEQLRQLEGGMMGLFPPPLERKVY
jgi:hypothetical protein